MNINYQSNTKNLSGIRFNSPVSFPRIEMEYIDVGDSNVITGYVTGVNIGSRNKIFCNTSTGLYALVSLTGITGLGPNQTPFTGITGQIITLIGQVPKKRNLNFGYENSTTDGGEVYNLGSNNLSYLSENLIQIGNNLYTLNIENGFIAGKDNKVTSGNTSIVIGNINNVNKSINSSLLGNANFSDFYAANIVGNQNKLYKGNGYAASILGNSNAIENSNSLNILGENNYFSGVDSDYTVGSNNTNIGTTGAFNSNNLILGKSNTILKSQNQIVVGNNNSTENATSSIIFGKNIYSKNIGNVSFGQGNYINGSNELIYGLQNQIEESSANDFILGVNNHLSGTNSNTIVGSNNTSDDYLLNSLYLQQLTGITGLGPNQTPFTGITGYSMSNVYTGIEPIGGAENFIVGENNKTTLNNNTYIFGNSNDLLNNQNSYIFGENNYAEKSTKSYVFGENNSVSGYKNYVVGNNNTIKEEDHNSIFIGISTEFSGAKIGSVNIGSSASNIQVDPGEINIYSPNKLKFNNENVIIESDLNSYLTRSNGLSNSSGIITYPDPYVFNDETYFGIPSQIEVQPFRISGATELYNTEFSGFGYVFENQPYFSGNFYKIYDSGYTFSDTWFGNNARFYFRSEDFRFSIAYDSGYGVQNIPNRWWINFSYSISQLPLFYSDSTDNSALPLTGWNALTGEDNPNILVAEAFNPPPVFKYENSQNYITKKEKLISIPTEDLNSIAPLYFFVFDVQGEKMYVSKTNNFSVIYGQHQTLSGYDPRWMIVSNDSSGIYAINNSDSNTIPQTGWLFTGYMGYSGFKYPPLGINESGDPNVDTLIKISLSKTGLASSYDPNIGKIYIPFLY